MDTTQLTDIGLSHYLPDPSAPLLTARDTPDAHFISIDPLGIPLLDLRYQARFMEMPLLPWGSLGRNKVMRGTWHFYVDDYRFEALWKDPTTVLNTQCQAAVEPNFSIGSQMPHVVGWYQIYRKRWIARYWQEMGLPIWVDMNVPPEFYAANLLGVPDGWRAYMTRGYTELLPLLDMEYALACEKAGTDDIDFVVYGGGADVEAFCCLRQYHYVREAMDCGKRNKSHGS